jgi:hypothetical protein
MVFERKGITGRCRVYAPPPNLSSHLVCDNSAGIDIGTEVEEHFEVAAVARFAPGQINEEASSLITS